MKKIFLIIILLHFKILSAQDNNIVAGVYNSNIIYYNYEPDTVLPYGTTLIYSSSLNIDLNFDGITDYEIYNLNAAGQMASQYNVTITPYNDNEVNYHRIDSIYYTLWDSTIYYHIPRPFIFGEVINNSSFYTSSIGYIYRDSWSSLSGFSHEIFDWDNIGDRYLGIRMNISDTLYYGWIRLNISTGVTVGGASQVTVKEYALSKSLSAGIFGPYHSEKIKVYPNPLYTDLNILLPQHFNSGNILILDVNGATRRSKRILNSGLITINVSDFESGFYTLRIVGDSNMFYSKIIKH